MQDRGIVQAIAAGILIFTGLVEMVSTSLLVYLGGLLGMHAMRLTDFVTC